MLTTTLSDFAKLILNSDIAVSSFVEQENTTEEMDVLNFNAHMAEIVINQYKLCTGIGEIVADLEGGTL